jgi:hypothetical protein
MRNLNQDDQAIKTPTYHDREIAWLYQEGLLSRLDADVFDILATTGSISSGPLQWRERAGRGGQ